MIPSLRSQLPALLELCREHILASDEKIGRIRIFASAEEEEVIKDAGFEFVTRNRALENAVYQYVRAPHREPDHYHEARPKKPRGFLKKLFKKLSTGFSGSKGK